MTRRISVFCVLPEDGSETLAWFVVGSLVLVLLPRLRTCFCFGSPRVVSVAKEPFSYLRFVLYAFFLPPEGFFLCRSPCQTDNVRMPLIVLFGGLST